MAFFWLSTLVISLWPVSKPSHENAKQIRKFFPWLKRLNGKTAWINHPAKSLSKLVCAAHKSVSHSTHSRVPFLLLHASWTWWACIYSMHMFPSSSVLWKCLYLCVSMFTAETKVNVENKLSHCATRWYDCEVIRPGDMAGRWLDQVMWRGGEDTWACLLCLLAHLSSYWWHKLAWKELKMDSYSSMNAWNEMNEMHKTCLHDLRAKYCTVYTCIYRYSSKIWEVKQCGPWP